MAGHALSLAEHFPKADLIGVEPDGADDFRQSIAAGERTRIDLPTSICDGLLSYDVGEHNWPILHRLVKKSVTVSDSQTSTAMRWLMEEHGIRTEPSGAITTAALLTGAVNPDGEGDVVAVLSGRNADEAQFRDWIA